MNVVKHVTTSVSKGIVTVQIKCTSSEGARQLHRALAEEAKAGHVVFDVDSPAVAAPTIAQRLAARDKPAPLPPKPSLFADEQPREAASTLAQVSP